MLFRHATTVLLGAIATIGLLVLMRSVIADPMPAEDTGVRTEPLEWVRIVEEHEPIPKTRKLERPPPPDEVPPTPPRPYTETGGTPIGEWEPPAPVVKGTPGLGGYMGNSTYLPIVRVAPVYPRKALQRHIEGYVLLEFVVTAKGTVLDPVVLVAEPPGFFERAALNAVVKFKYQPKVVDGQAVEVTGVRTRVVFEIADD